MYGSHFEIVDAQPLHWLESERWRPARTGGVTPLLLEIVATVARGRQRQVVWALAPNVGSDRVAEMVLSSRPPHKDHLSPTVAV